ncbi:XRE family transcriptional regulator [Amycolatopsis cynarae]|uniref:XRE family transcriptional regulator n=1 Tax=Amycolatopsis cynarae TaxID=2995223 RepID=A0ABY7B439_9PSEU|nr:XRE family transcriptional regulator [Amycolatopsis sp. HUAS 11-8]WAL65998.1 XRE family transcriptional regulator [Amycolatopsis sp. HUAS 11-8]
MTTPADPDLIGPRLRTIRMAKGISARDLAERAGVAPAYISRLETGKISPTVASLSRVMQAMGESVGALFGQDTAGDSPVVRRADRQLVRSHGVEDYRLTPASADRLEVLETVVAPGRGSGDSPYTHPGDQECVLVLAGSLTIWLAEQEYVLDAGDTITFTCRTPHRWSNVGSVPTRALWIITPATY